MSFDAWTTGQGKELDDDDDETPREVDDPDELTAAEDD